MSPRLPKPKVAGSRPVVRFSRCRRGSQILAVFWLEMQGFQPTLSPRPSCRLMRRSATPPNISVASLSHRHPHRSPLSVMARRPPVVTCTHHCAGCGRHFHSLEAFDAHHHRDPTGWLHCLPPASVKGPDGQPRLQLLSTDGQCRMHDTTQRGVTVWTDARRYGTKARNLRTASESPRWKHRRHATPPRDQTRELGSPA